MRVLYHHRTRSTDAQRIHIVEMLNAFRDLGHQVEEVALAPAETGPQNTQQNLREARWKSVIRPFPFVSELLQLGYNVVGVPILLGKLLRTRVDFIYERYALFNFAGVLTARLLRVPIMVEVNSPLALEQRREGDIRCHALASRAERLICNLATRVIAVSGALRRILIEEGVDAAKVVVIPNGVNLDRFPDRRQKPEVESRLRKTLHFKDKVIIGFVGWFRKWHRLELLLEAFRDSDLLRQKAAVLLVGDGPAMAELQELIRKWRLQACVTFTGPLPHDQIPNYLGLIDIAVQPFANEYCCPMKILEYMAMGKPIVAPEQDNIRELVRNNREARLFTPGDKNAFAQALETLVSDPVARSEIGRRARAAVTERHLLWTRNAERAISLVDQSR